MRSYHADAAYTLLENVGMADQADRLSGVLAYGDLKRLELAIALANDPSLLLMDEPTAGMAPGERNELMALVSSLVRSHGASVLFTEHDMDVVFGHADRILVLNRGSVVVCAPPNEVRVNPEVQAVYLNESPSETDDGELGQSAP
jgi:branched-chain amino acid transport system ATP-binding protein